MTAATTHTAGQVSENAMTPQQAWGGHCTRGGTIASGNAICECGLWTAADYPSLEARRLARKQHLDLVVSMRRNTR